MSWLANLAKPELGTAQPQLVRTSYTQTKCTEILVSSVSLSWLITQFIPHGLWDEYKNVYKNQFVIAERNLKKERKIWKSSQWPMWSWIIVVCSHACISEMELNYYYYVRASLTLFSINWKKYQSLHFQHKLLKLLKKNYFSIT